MTLAIFYYLSFALLNNIRLRDIFKKEAYMNTNVKRIIGAVGMGMGFSAILMGTLFKLQFWTGAEFQLETGLVFTGILTAIALYFYIRNQTAFLKRIFKRVAIIGLIGMITWLIPEARLLELFHKTQAADEEFYDSNNYNDTSLKL
jgi:hypothetical protein